MPETTVADIRIGEKNFQNKIIEAIYGKVSKLYAVYRTADNQVLVQFADADTQGANQRAELAPLGPMRSEIEVEIEALPGRKLPWDFLARRSAEDAEAGQQEARAHAARLARTLLMALQGDQAGALAEISRQRDEIRNSRASVIRTSHLIFALLSTLAIILLCKWFSTAWFQSSLHDFGHYTPDYWAAAAIGGIGALASIAFRIRARDIPVDITNRDNFLDAVLRIGIGAVSAAILFALFDGKLVTLQLGGAALQLPDGEDGKAAWLVILSFTTGFTERLVANFIGGLSLTPSRRGLPRVRPSGLSPIPTARMMMGAAAARSSHPRPRLRTTRTRPIAPKRMNSTTPAPASAASSIRRNPSNERRPPACLEAWRHRA